MKVRSKAERPAQLLLWDQKNFPPNEIETSLLDLDDQNPRLSEGFADEASQEDIIRTLWEQFSLDELALSICHNGFWRNEPLFAVPNGKRYTVIEGNRRLATVKLLGDAQLREKLKATDLAEAPKSVLTSLKTLPVVVFPKRAIAWPLLGFRHINGPVRWEPLAKARYIQQVHESGVPLSEIAARIGDKNFTVVRLYQGIIVADQAIEAGYDPEDRTAAQLSLSHLYTGLRYPGIQKFLGIRASNQPVKVPRSHYPQLLELMIWLFGSKSRKKVALIKSQNPDLRTLEEVLKTPRGIAALRSDLGLDRATEITQGDDRRFLEAVTQARYSIQQARGLVQDGYDGDDRTLDEVRSVKHIATLLIDEMVLMGKSVEKKNDRKGKSGPSE